MNTSKTLTYEQLEENKQKILELFRLNVKNKRADVAEANIGHDGKYGHWLEAAMGIARNNSNSPDLLGFEMKNTTQSKTSFGDWSADYRIYSKRSGGVMTQGEFLRFFGQPNAKHQGRYAWSGRICPNKVGPFNEGGQKLLVDVKFNIHAIYSFSHDMRPDKDKIIPKEYQKNLILATWSSELMRRRVEDKFNQNGWFKCLTDPRTGIYTSIVFGEPITFSNWITYLDNGDVIFDSGMHEGNPRPYANWRASNTFWNKLVTSRYS
ncbi:MAG: LlaMI family restriction endonuclease [Candidatus Saccharibacteria bacterium]